MYSVQTGSNNRDFFERPLNLADVQFLCSDAEYKKNDYSPSSALGGLIKSAAWKVRLYTIDKAMNDFNLDKWAGRSH